MNSYVSREQDYALRISAYLSGLEEGAFVTVKELSEKLDISKNFAARIVHKLKLNGFVQTIQGPKGGVYFIRDPKQTSIYDILNVIGFKTKINTCYCRITNFEKFKNCKFHIFFYEQEKVLLDTFKKAKLSHFTI